MAAGPMYSIIFIIYVYYPWEFTASQGFYPKMSVSPKIIGVRESVELRCEGSQCGPGSQCCFSLLGTGECRYKPQLCQLILTGRELMRWAGEDVPASINLQCSCADGERSDPASVTVREIPPELKVSPNSATKNGSVLLSCEDSQSAPVSKCIFSLVDKKAHTYTLTSCQLSLTGEELMRWARLDTLPAQIRVKCSIADEPSQHSNPVSVSVEAPGTPPKPQLKISPAVMRETDSVQMSCEVAQSQSASLCLFYLDGIKAAAYSHSSCQISLTGVQILQWTRQSSPLEAKVGCYYHTTSAGQQTASAHSDTVSLTVLDKLQKPSIKVLYDDSMSIVCDIPKHFGEATHCHLYTGDEPQFYMKSKTSKHASGDMSCQFTGNKDDLFRRLQSLRSRRVSCDYTVNTEPPSLSPRSDPDISTAARNSSTATSLATFTTTATSTSSSKSTLTSTSSSRSTFTSTSTSTSASEITKTAKITHPSSPGLLSWAMVVLVVGLFLVILTASCFCYKRQKHTRPLYTTHRTSTTVRFHPEDISMEKVGDGSPHTPLVFSGGDVEEDPGEDVANSYHVYSTIPDPAELSNHHDTPYSLAQAQSDPVTTQQGLTYSFLQKV